MTICGIGDCTRPATGWAKVLHQATGAVDGAEIRSACDLHRDFTVEDGIAQATLHGHPTWSHVTSHGPCTRTDR